MVVFALAHCPICNKDFALAPDYTQPGTVIVFLRDGVPNVSHMCVGGLLCEQGHILEVTAPAAVLATTGHWLVLGQPPAVPAAN